MAITTSWNYGTSGTFNKSIATNERIWLSGSSSSRTNLEVDQWSPATIITNSDGTNVVGVANNNRYISPTQISVNEGSIKVLSEVETPRTDVTFKITWSDTSLDTALSNGKFYAYNGVTPSVPPTNMSVVAYEHIDTGIRKNRVGGDLAGLAWNEDGGINGLSNALSLASQASALSHDYYIGLSVKVLAYGLQSGSKLRISFDVS